MRITSTLVLSILIAIIDSIEAGCLNSTPRDKSLTNEVPDYITLVSVGNRRYHLHSIPNTNLFSTTFLFPENHRFFVEREDAGETPRIEEVQRGVRLSVAVTRDGEIAGLYKRYPRSIRKLFVEHNQNQSVPGSNELSSANRRIYMTVNIVTDEVRPYDLDSE